jgi:hypothetical protein
MLRPALAATMLFLVTVGWIALPPPGLGSCARTVSLEEISRKPHVAVFTGEATGKAPRGYDVVFAVDRWYQGPHASRVVRILGSTAGLSENQDAGVVSSVLAEVVAGDAISLAAGEPVLIVATWDEDSGTFAVYFCSLAGVRLDSPEGRAALRAAEAAFGPGRRAADLPATDTMHEQPVSGAGPTSFVRDWWPLIAALAAAATMVRTWHHFAAVRRPRRS